MGDDPPEGNLLGAYGQARVSYIDCADIAACAAVLLATERGSGERYVANDMC